MRILPLLLGRGLRVEVELVRRPTVEVQIGGVTYQVPEQVSQALEQERKAQAAELAARAAVAPAELEAARAGEKAVRELLAAAEARAARLEAELVEEHRRQDELFNEAIRVGVAAADADVELVGEVCTWDGAVGQA